MIDTLYSGGELYYICYRNGQYHVMRDSGYDEVEDDCIYSGFYEDCKSMFLVIREENVDYDYNL